MFRVTYLYRWAAKQPIIHPVPPANHLSINLDVVPCQPNNLSCTLFRNNYVKFRPVEHKNICVIVSCGQYKFQEPYKTKSITNQDFSQRLNLLTFWALLTTVLAHCLTCW